MYFLTIAVVAAVMFLASLLFGDHGDIGDVGGFDHGHGHDSHFSIQSLLLFCIGFGASGAIVRAEGGDTNVAVIAGLIFGVAAVFGGSKITKFFQRQEGDSTLRADDLKGAKGYVTMEIPASGCGEVLITDRRGLHVYRRAYSEQETVILVNKPIEVNMNVGDVVYVKERMNA